MITTHIHTFHTQILFIDAPWLFWMAYRKWPPLAADLALYTIGTNLFIYYLLTFDQSHEQYTHLHRTQLIFTFVLLLLSKQPILLITTQTIHTIHINILFIDAPWLFWMAYRKWPPLVADLTPSCSKNKHIHMYSICTIHT